MNETIGSDKTLSKNGIKNFVLKIDLITKEELDIGKIAEKMSVYFDRTEKRQVSNFTINFTKENSEICKKEAFDYVLISEEKSISMTFSETGNCFLFETQNYTDNSVYKEFVKKVIGVINESVEGVESKRIGMRYINDFSCGKISDVSKIFGKRLSSILKIVLREDKQIRSIVMEEYSNDEYKLRLQYGVPNKYYPSILSVYDLRLDIDSYIQSTCTINDWEKIIKDLNHESYAIFVKEMNEKYLESLK